MKFEDYHISSEIKKNLAKLDFKRPTDIQFKSIPAILKGEDVLAIAQTGTGKTAAFAIPVIDLIHNKKKDNRKEGISCVVMVPTRELAEQINSVFEKLCRHTRVKSMCVYGGVEEEPQIAKLAKGVDIVIATPGRLFDLASRSFINLHRTDILILDEADHMLDLGFINDIRDLLKNIPKHHQTLFFSATINDKIKRLAYSLVKNPIRIQVSPKDPVSKNVDHVVAKIEMDDKRFFLERLMKEFEDSKVLVFVRTKVRAERVVKAMERVNIVAESLHGGKDQESRSEILNKFKIGAIKLLVATDVSARGIDIPNVDYVVNYDLPENPENYVHRVGRTGRGKNRGNAIAFCSSDEQELLNQIEEYMGKTIKILEIDPVDYSGTIDFSPESSHDWKTLMIEDDIQPSKIKKKAKKKKKKNKF